MGTSRAMKGVIASLEWLSPISVEFAIHATGEAGRAWVLERVALAKDVDDLEPDAETE